MSNLILKNLFSFLSGFFSTLTFHQGVLGLLFLVGVFPAKPFNMTPVDPLGVPAVLSLAFWGGVWGCVLSSVIRHAIHEKSFWWKAVVFGAVGPSFVALAIVFPLKGISFNIIMIPFALLLNAAWGLGWGFFLFLFTKMKVTQKV